MRTDPEVSAQRRLLIDAVAAQYRSEIFDWIRPISDLAECVHDTEVNVKASAVAIALVHGRDGATEAAAEVLGRYLAVDQTPPLQWWSTPLGRLVATFGDVDGWMVSQSEAAEILGVVRGTISRLCFEGKFQSSADGLHLSDVLDRMLRLTK